MVPEMVEAFVTGVENSRGGKMLKSPSIGHFSEFLRRAKKISHPMLRDHP